VLLHRGIDPKTTKNTALVCKDWHSLIAKGKNDFRINLNTGKSELLINFLAYPYAFGLAHAVLAPQFPHEPVYSKFNPALKNKETETETQSLTQLDSVPEHIEGFASLINERAAYDPYLCESLCQKFISLDPKYFKSAGFVAYILEKSPALQKQLCTLLDENPIDLTKFSVLVEDPKNHKPLKKHLMGLKLLTLSGDGAAKTEMDEFEKILSVRYQDAMQTGMWEASALNQPFWSAYMVNTGDNTLLETELHLLNQIMAGPCRKQLKLQPIEAFFQYVCTLAPQLLRTPEVHFTFHSNLESLQKLYAPKLSSEEIALKDQEYRETLYLEEMENLKTELEDAGDFSERFAFLLHIADLILGANDQDNFPTAAAHIKTVLEEFGDAEELECLSHFTGATPSVIAKYDVIASLCALQILQGDFKAAYKNIKAHKLPCHMGLIDHEPLLKAVQIQHSRFPKKLKEIFKEEFLLLAWNTLGQESFIYENEEVLLSLMKGHPLEKRELKKDLKKLKKGIPVEESSFEEKEEESPERKDVSAGKEKSKKHKKDKH